MKFSIRHCRLLLPLILTACTTGSDDYFPGYAEGEYVRLASSLGGSLTQLQVQSGQQVRRGAPAFALEQGGEATARAEATYRWQRAQANLENLKKGRRPDELATLQEQLAQARAALRLSAADLMRKQQLLRDSFIAAAGLDAARAAHERDQAQVRAVQAQVRLARLGARSDEIAAAEKESQAAQAQLAHADWALAQKTVSIPLDAQVVEVLYRVGEMVAPGSPVVSLLPPENIKARFFVPQERLGSLQPGQEVQLSCDGCGAPVAARISYISPAAEYTAPIIYSKEKRAHLVYMLEARPQAADAARLHPGQPLEIRVKAATSMQTGGKAG